MLDVRRGKVDYDASKPVYTFWDLGHNDHTAIWFVQRVGMYYNLIHCYQNRLEKIPHYLEYLQNLSYNYGYHYLPHDGDHETLAARSVAKQLRDKYPKMVKIVPRIAKKDMGIKAARIVFDLCNFNEESTAEGWQCLTHYKYGVNEDGSWTINPLHDEYSHGADAFATFALSLKPETEVKKPKIVVPGERLGLVHSQTGWMSY